MTTSANLTKFRYEGNGVTDTFSYPARIFSENDIIVEIITRSTDALEETLSITTDYSVVINGDESASFQVTNASKIPSSTQDIQLRRSLAEEQNSVLPTGTVFPAKTVEKALDRNTALIQDMSERVSRSIKLSATSSLSDLETPAPVANAVLGWNSTKTALVNYVFGDISTDIDTAFTSLADNDFITYDATDEVFINSNVSATRGKLEIAKINATTSAPTVDDDDTEGYSFNSTWTNTSTGYVYVCVNAATGAADWKPLNIIASESEATTGTNNTTIMTPLRVAQVLDSKAFNYDNKIVRSNNSIDAEHDIDFSAGNFFLNDGVKFTSALAKTKRLDALYANGDGNGGLDTGTIAADTKYYCYVISNTGGSTTDFLFTATYDSPTMPSGYTQKSYLGMIKTDSSANIIPFDAIGNHTYYKKSIHEDETNNPSTSEVTHSISVPDASNIIADVTMMVFDSTAGVDGQYGMVAPVGESEAVTRQNADFAYNAGSTGQNVFGSGRKCVASDSSGQIATRVSVSDGDVTQYLKTNGFYDGNM